MLRGTPTSRCSVNLNLIQAQGRRQCRLVRAARQKWGASAVPRPLPGWTARYTPQGPV